MKIELKKISWHLVWILACLEGITVVFLPYFTGVHEKGQIIKSPILGLFLGYIGMLAALLLINAFGKSFLRNVFAEGKIEIRKPFIVSVWGSVYLALIFLFQLVFTDISNTYFVTVIRAIFSVSVSTLIFLVLYKYMHRLMPWLSVKLVFGKDEYRFLGVTVLPAVVFISLYEAIALPIIELFRNFENYQWQSGLFLGVTAGAFAITLVIICYNNLALHYSGLKASISLEKLD
ncbi:hypothetical protein ACFL58_00455 [Elusimicrobiota bacterium]